METYVKIPDRIMCNKNLSPAAKLIYGLLVSLCQSKGYCWATNSALAERLGMGRKSMTRLLRELRVQGLIYYDKTGGTGAERNAKRLLRLTELEEIAPDERRDISGEADVDSSRDFDGWLNQCIARMEQAKQQWAQSRPDQPEHGGSAGVGQEMQTAATPKTAGDAGFGAQEVRTAVVEKVCGNAGFVAPERQEVRPTVPVKTPDFSGFAVQERREVQPSALAKALGNAGFTVPERQETQPSSQPRTPGHAGYAMPERQENRTPATSPKSDKTDMGAMPERNARAVVMPEIPGNTGFRGQNQRELRPSAPVKAPAHAGFVAPERQDVRPAAPVKTPDFSGVGVPEKQEDRVAAIPRTPGNAGFTVPERREARPATPAKAPAHAGFTAPERQESPEPAQLLPSTQALPSQTDPVLSNWIQIRHRDWSQEDRAQFSGFWQTYWQERQQQGNPFPEKPIRHRFLERVNLLSGGDRATMQDILRHHRISQ